MARELPQGNASHKIQLLDYANQCYPPAYKYFQDKFDNDLKNVVSAFKAARYFLPWKVHELKPTTSNIESLKAFPFIDANLLSHLKGELAEYIAASEGLVESINLFKWWEAKERNNKLMNWVRAPRLVALVQPTSLAAERVFSILNSSFNAQQRTALKDYNIIQISLIYNSQ